MQVSDIKRCRRCDAVVNDHTLGGLCPICLLGRSLDECNSEFESSTSVIAEPAKSFGDFELVEEIARGGMGVVYRARQRGLDRAVALKIIIGGPWAPPVLRERFLQEARTGATLDHPNIVPVFDYGEHAGHAFLSLRLIEGGTLAHALEQGRLSLTRGESPESIARFFSQIANAVYHAHQRGVLHRDIKPSNILIDKDGRPLVTDFGLAKLRDLESSLTHSSAVLGTPSYMAPEQASGKSAEVTVAADLYSLGAVLYEMLTGRPPFIGDTPLKTIQQVADHRLTPPERLNPHIPRDLGIICMKCLRWRPEDRYASATDLEADLQRWLKREPIEARSITPVERVGYWIRSRPAVASLSFVVAALLIVGIILGSSQAVRLHRATVAAEESATESRDRLRQLYLQNWQTEIRSGHSLGSLPWLFESMKLSEPGTRAMRLHQRRMQSVIEASPEVEQMWFPGRMIEKISISPDGSLLAACQYGGQVHVWNTITGERAFPAIEHTNHIVGVDVDTSGYNFIWNVEFSPDGRHLLTACNNYAYLWDAHTGQAAREPFRHPNKIWQTKFDSTGDRFATVGLDRHARVFRVNDGEELFTSPIHPRVILAVDFGPDGTLLATGCRDGGARVFDISTGEEVQPALKHDGHVTTVIFHPTGEQLATASKDGTARIWNLKTGDSRVLPHEGSVSSIAFSPNGEFVVTASADTRTRVWKVDTGRLHFEPLKHAFPANEAVFSPDGSWVLSASDDGLVRGANVSTGIHSSWSVPHNHHLTDVVFLPDGDRFATVSADGVVRLCHMPFSDTTPTRTDTPIQSGLDWELVTSQGNNMAFRRQGKTIAEHSTLPNGIYRAIPSPQRRNVYLIDRGFEGHVWDLVANEMRPFRWATNECLETAAFTSDGRRLVLNCSPEEVVIWDLDNDELAPFRSRHEKMVNHVAISADDRFYATASDEPAARIWNMEDGEPLSPPLRHADFVRLVAFSPDATLLVSAGLDGNVKLWSVPDGKPMAPSFVHPEPIEHIQFSPSGHHLATVTVEGDVRVWRTGDGAQLTPPIPHSAGIRFLHFADGDQLFQTTMHNGIKQIWDIESDCMVTLPYSGSRNLLEYDVAVDATFIGNMALLEDQIKLLSGALIGPEGTLQRVDLTRLAELWSQRD